MAKSKQKAASNRVLFVPAGSEDGQDRVVSLHKPNPGPQSLVLGRPEYEILYGGAKGGGKTHAGRLWLLKGNPMEFVRGNRQIKLAQYLDPNEPGISEAEQVRRLTDYTYIHNPYYRALVLRLNRKDMDDWLTKARMMYEPMGAHYRESPTTEFEWPSGAKFLVDHLADDSVWTKWAGNEVHRILLEEANQIPSKERYSMVAINCRSTVDRLLPQIFLTANPGGPGTNWLKEHFHLDRVDTYGKTLARTLENPFTGERSSVTRIYIPAKLSDNPVLMERDPQYAVRLMADLGSQAKIRALLHGDWMALDGAYFDIFRAAHVQGEPENACHVIHAGSVDLFPWWQRWIGMDWGYGHASAVFWACCDPLTKRVHVYREKVAKNVGSREWGRTIARMSIKDLEGLGGSVSKPNMALYLSPDTFAKRDAEKTIAEQIQWGIQDILGPNSCALITDAETGGKDFFETIEFQSNASITIRRAQNQRVAGWEYMRNLMRWEPFDKEVSEEYDVHYAMELAQKFGSDKYFEYRRKFEEKAQQEILPKLLIHDCCPKLISAIPSAIYDKDGEDVLKTTEVSDDVLDAARYTLMAHKIESSREPKSEFIKNRLTALGDPQDGRHWAAMKAAEDYDNDAKAVPFTARRSSARRRMVVQ